MESGTDHHCSYHDGFFVYGGGPTAAAAAATTTAATKAVPVDCLTLV